MISVIIPTYNRASTLERSIRSVLEQTYQNLECIIIDDASTDNTHDIVAEITDLRLRYYCMGKNMGACAARNKGIELARGDYIAFQDSDDVWIDTKLEMQRNALLSSGADVCFCKLRRFAVYNNKSDEWPVDLKEGIIPYKILYKSPKVSTQTILAQKYVFDNFKFDENVKKAQDYEWTIRAGERYRFFFVDQPLVNQYFQSDSISVVGEKVYQIGKDVREYLYKKFQDKYEEYPSLEVAILEQLAMYKSLIGENAVQEYKKVYQLTGAVNDFLKYLASRSMPWLLKQFYLFELRGSRELKLDK